MIRTLIAMSCAAIALAGSPARAASPTVSTRAGSPATCGGPQDLCEPALDPLGALPFPLSAPSASAAGSLYGLVAGDDLSSLSLGRDSFTPTDFILVSVRSGATACSPPAGTPDICSEATAAQAAADVFFVGSPGAALPALLVLDGDGAAAGFPAPPPPFPGIGLADSGGDDIDALEACGLAGMGPTQIFFTLAPGSPSLGTLGASAADVLTAPPGGSPAVLYSAASMGLAAGDVVDALAMDGSTVWLSLAPGSPTLGALSATPADLLKTGLGPAGPISIALTLLGLTATDDVDALAVIPDADFDLVNDRCDSCPVASNGNQTDSDADGLGDLCDPCTVVAATQTSTRSRIVLRKLNAANGERVVIGKGGFVPAVTSPTIDPATNGAHVRLTDPDAGTLLDADIPGGLVGSSSCDPRDGWVLKGAAPATPGKKIWKYANHSGAVEPLCVPGSAGGVSKVLVKDLGDGRFRYVVKAKRVSLSLEPSDPIVSLRFDFTLGAETAPGYAGTAAVIGECADSLLTGAGPSPPYCRQIPAIGTVKTIQCKGP